MDFVIGLWLFLVAILVFSNGIVFNSIQRESKTINPPDYSKNKND